MSLLNKYDLYNSEGKKMFTVIPGKKNNTLLGMPHTAFVKQEHKLTDSELRQFKAGDRVHVTRFDCKEVDLYATLKETRAAGVFYLIDCTNYRYESVQVYTPKTKDFGPDKTDYYTLATDEEDTEEPEVQHVNDKFSFARSKSYDIQEYIQEGNNLNMKEGCAMPTIKTKKEMNLAELIEWGFKQKELPPLFYGYKEGSLVQFTPGGWVNITAIEPTDTFTVEIEEEITGDTVIPRILEIGVGCLSGYSAVKENVSVNRIINKKNNYIYIIDDDYAITPFCRDGKLVE